MQLGGVAGALQHQAQCLGVQLVAERALAGDLDVQLELRVGAGRGCGVSGEGHWQAGRRACGA